MQPPPISDMVTFLYTKNLKSTSHFYQQIMGFPMVLDQGRCQIYQLCSNSYLGFCEREGVDSEHAQIICTLVTPYVDEWFQFLSKRGIEFVKTPSHNPDFQIYHCFLRDPNGYLIEIQTFLDPRWESQ